MDAEIIIFFLSEKDHARFLPILYFTYSTLVERTWLACPPERIIFVSAWSQRARLSIRFRDTIMLSPRPTVGECLEVKIIDVLRPVCP